MKQQKVGILGGGQLGSMVIRQAIDFGLDISVMDKDPYSPCARYTSGFYVGDPQNYADVLDFGKDVDIITIEKEAVDTKALRMLAKQGKKILPSPEIIATIQNKHTQKQMLMAADIPVASAILVNGKDDIRNNIDKLPGCLKKCLNGYDGKGVMMIRNEQDIHNAFEELSLLEELIDVKHEISTIVARSETGEVKCYDPVLMVFDGSRHLLDYQVCPAGISEQTAAQARDLAIRTANALNFVGILAVEMFLTNDDRLIVNELAPRPHNSGHHTIEANITSQYEQLIRIILGAPLGDIKTTSSSVMLNIIGPITSTDEDLQKLLSEILLSDNTHLHWYGKKQGTEGRKLGHITITGESVDNALLKAAAIRNILKHKHEKN